VLVLVVDDAPDTLNLLHVVLPLWGASVYVRCVFLPSVKSILRISLDRQLTLDLPPDRPSIQHANIRGTDYFNPEEEQPC
jgi:hypothetical protein